MLNFKKEAKNILYIIIACVLGAVGLHVFVYSSDFAPMGVDGIATMLQSLTKVNAGVYSLILNLPLLIVARIFLKKRYVIYTLIYTAVSSGLLMLFDAVGLWQYIPENERLISAIFSGILLGLKTGIMIRIGGSSGGADIVGSIVSLKKPYSNVERIISIVCYVIMGLSFFIYGNLDCIFLSIVQMIIFEGTVNKVLSPTRNATEVKIITKYPEEIKKEILYNLKHGATIVQSKGMFTRDDSAIIYSVINNHQIPEFMTIVNKYASTFVYYTDVKLVQGNFRRNKDDIAK